MLTSIFLISLKYMWIQSHNLAGSLLVLIFWGASLMTIYGKFLQINNVLWQTIITAIAVIKQIDKIN